MNYSHRYHCTVVQGKLYLDYPPSPTPHPSSQSATNSDPSRHFCHARSMVWPFFLLTPPPPPTPLPPPPPRKCCAKYWKTLGKVEFQRQLRAGRSLFLARERAEGCGCDDADRCRVSRGIATVFILAYAVGDAVWCAAMTVMFVLAAWATTVEVSLFFFLVLLFVLRKLDEEILSAGGGRGGWGEEASVGVPFVQYVQYVGVNQDGDSCLHRYSLGMAMRRQQHLQ